MLPFLRKSVNNISPFFKDFVDIHTHILPGVDDGVQTTEDAITLLDYYSERGVKHVIFTPHIMSDLVKNNAEYLRTRFLEFKGIYKGNITLSLGAEYMLDQDFELHLVSDDILTLSDKNILVETSYINPPINFSGIVYDIQCKGYDLVLAHPERYRYMELKDYMQLKEKNVKFQLNLLSLLGRYGTTAQHKSKKLLKMQMYDYIGSDIHNLNYHREAFNQRMLTKSEAQEICRLACNNNDFIKY